jgi:two-component system, response regulator
VPDRKLPNRPHLPPAPILLIEDSDEDYEAVRWALRRLGREVPLLRSPDGDSALDQLRGEGRWSGQPLWPALILLDLNLPGTDGRDVLADLKADRRLRSVPVVIMTTSSNPRDIQECAALGANSYTLKVVDFDRFVSRLQLMLDFWLGTVLLPPDPGLLPPDPGAVGGPVRP